MTFSCWVFLCCPEVIKVEYMSLFCVIECIVFVQHLSLSVVNWFELLASNWHLYIVQQTVVKVCAFI